MKFTVFKPKRFRKGKRITSRLYRGRYRLDNDVSVTDIPLMTSDKQIAVERLRKVIKEKQQESAGIIAPKALRDAAKKPLTDHLADFIADLNAKGRDDMYIYIIEKLTIRVFRECEWKMLPEVTVDSFTTWRSRQTMAPKTLNEYLDTLNGILNWMQLQGRLAANPLRSVGKVQTQGMEVRIRRATTDIEMKRLMSCVSIEHRALYLMAAYTGLRRAELESLIWADVQLDVEIPYVKARASTTKNHKDAVIWLHKDVIKALKAIMPENTDKLSKVFDKLPSMDQFREDLKRAGIQYKDSQGRQADFHALRYKFRMSMEEANVSPRVTMALMRHSDMRLTQNTYTDAKQLQTSKAIESLPSILGDDSPIDSPQLGVDSHLVAQTVSDETSGNTAEVVANKGQSHSLARSGTDCQKSQLVAGLGFEPRQTDSESVVLPLHNPAVGASAVFLNNQHFLL